MKKISKENYFYYIIGIIINISFKFFNPDKYPNENIIEEKLSIEELITIKAYPLEIHNVETEDGYILKLFRIPGYKGDEKHENKTRQPIIFQHGFLDSSDGWVCNSEDKSLPYILANSGFDVWLSNSRGNKYCKAHKVYSATSYEFWSFSFHEMGLYDIPAVLDYLYRVNLSGEKIIYIGHSQGNCMLFAALTEKLEYFKSRIKLFIALAPVAHVGGLKSRILKTMETLKYHKILKTAKEFEIFPSSESISQLNSWMSNNFNSISHLLMDLISENNSKTNNNKERLGVYLTHFPAGTSLKAASHFIQNYKLKKFCYYDYKEEANMCIYKRTTPPEYNLNKIKNFPIIMLAGKEDKLATLEDVRWLKEKLGENVIYYNEFDNMGHITFLLGKDVNWFYEAYEVMMKYCHKRYIEEVD